VKNGYSIGETEEFNWKERRRK